MPFFPCAYDEFYVGKKDFFNTIITQLRQCVNAISIAYIALNNIYNPFNRNDSLHLSHTLCCNRTRVVHFIINFSFEMGFVSPQD
jgi:hypothetical protein